MADKGTAMELQDRLALTKYSRNACVAAIRGQSIPNALGHPLHRLCIIRGIRYHDSFGHELRGLLPAITRALHARSIMSNVVPDIETPEEVPYCIWHPETASEDTYRKVVQRYPHMAYLVGRACAVAGYAQLYHELHILPDVHIAEEARECGNAAIFEAIMSQTVRYSVMDDYMRSINVDLPKPARLNGDTAVRWMLDVRQKFKDAESDFWDLENGRYLAEDIFGSMGWEETTFNITEDWAIDEVATSKWATQTASTYRDLRLLSEPLPEDLPTVDKDILIVMAAYCGNIDRYTRLRRPMMVLSEIQCCVRGIYHNTLFALWWSRQPDKKSPRIQTAINARFIMNDMLSGAPYPEYHTPYLIWWPITARPSTYRQLAKQQPDMLPQIVRACIYGGYKHSFQP